MSNYGVPALSEGMQGPTFSKLGSQISAAKNADVTSGSSLSGGQGMLILFSDMRDTLQSIQKNTLETAQILKTAVMGNAAANRDASLSGSDTDTDTPPAEKGPGLLSRVGGSLKGAASSFLGSTLGKLALAAGGFALLKIFGNNAIVPLSKLIESIKKGKIGENISGAYEYIKEIGVGQFKELKKNTILFIDGVKKMFKLIEGAYTAINDYVMSFDTKGGTSTQLFGSQTQIKKGDGILDKGELKDLRNDLIKKTAAYVGSLIGDVFKAILALIPLSQIVPISVGLGFTALKRSIGIGAAAGTGMMAAGGANAAAAATRGSKSAAKFGMKGMLGVAGVGLIVANSIFQIYSGITNALANSLNDDGTTDYSSFVAYFFGGQKKGSGLNAIIQANSVGGMFAGPAAIAGLAVGGLPGALIGGALGYGIGVIVGGISGYMGADNLNDVINIVGSSLKDGLVGIANFFKDFVEGIGNVASGGSFSDAFDKDEIDRKRKQLNKFINRTGINPETMSLDEAVGTLGPEPENKGKSVPDAYGGGMKYIPDANYMQFLTNKQDIEYLYKLQSELGGIITEGVPKAAGEVGAAELALEEHLAKGGGVAIPGTSMDQNQADFAYDLKTKQLKSQLQKLKDKAEKFQQEQRKLTLPGNLQSPTTAELEKIRNTQRDVNIAGQLNDLIFINDQKLKMPGPNGFINAGNDNSTKIQTSTNMFSGHSQDRPATVAAALAIAKAKSFKDNN